MSYSNGSKEAREWWTPEKKATIIVLAGALLSSAGVIMVDSSNLAVQVLGVFAFVAGLNLVIGQVYHGYARGCRG
jgi:hypothetical protein